MEAALHSRVTPPLIHSTNIYLLCPWPRCGGHKGNKGPALPLRSSQKAVGTKGGRTEVRLAQVSALAAGRAEEAG